MSSDRRQDQRRVHILRQADPVRERIFPCDGRASTHVSRQRLHGCSVTSTTRPAHGSPRPGRTAAGARGSFGTGPPPGHNAGTRAEHQRLGTRRAVRAQGTPDHRRPALTHRPQAGTAIRWPWATPPRIPPRGRRNKVFPDPEDVPPAVATTGTTSTCCPGRRHVAFVTGQPGKRRSGT